MNTKGVPCEKFRYTWQYEKLSHAIVKPRQKRNKQDIKQAIDYLKKVMLNERDSESKRKLASAGIELNNLLIR